MYMLCLDCIDMQLRRFVMFGIACIIDMVCSRLQYCTIWNL